MFKLKVYQEKARSTRFTVLGASGFVGSHLAKALEGEVYAPSREEHGWLQRDLGHVFYCIGLTANFRERPFDTVEAHVCLLRRVLEQAQFESLTYLSSTRVYEGAAATSEESALQVSPANPGHLYNLSKLMGESLCLASGRNTRIARLSNVFGCGMRHSFLAQVLEQAANSGRIQFLTAAASAKDYVSVNDVVRWLPRIALVGTQSIYNLAQGENLSNADLSLLLQGKDVEISYAADAPEWSFPAIDTRRLAQEFGAAQHRLADEFDALFDSFKDAA